MDNNSKFITSLENEVFEFVEDVERELHSIISERTNNVAFGIKKVLDAFYKERLGTHHFFSVNGYGHNDLGKDLIDKVFAEIFGAEKAAIRMQLVSGTHAIAAALFGILRPGDNLLSITGKPYETLEEVIGIRGKGKGSLIEFGITYDEISIFQNDQLDLDILLDALKIKRKMIFIQRSCGYSVRPSLSINDIETICKKIHELDSETVCFVDNCYGEFVELKEPSQVGADIIAGSLIKNPGGTIVPAGGYIAGKADLVEKACCRLTSPGIGSQGGSSFDLNRLVLQGLFLAPQMVSEALIGAEIISSVFLKLGFDVKPLPGTYRSDLIQAVCFGNPEILKMVCSAFQLTSPVGSYLKPTPSGMPGYKNQLIMSGGTFIDGSTSEFSADAPLISPYNLFVQGGTHRSHIKLAVTKAIVLLLQAGYVRLPHNS